MYTSQNLLRGNDETTAVKSDFFFTIIYNRIYIFMGLNKILLLYDTIKTTLCIKITPFLVKNLLYFSRVNEFASAKCIIFDKPWEYANLVGI